MEKRGAKIFATESCQCFFLRIMPWRMREERREKREREKEEALRLEKERERERERGENKEETRDKGLPFSAALVSLQKRFSQTESP